MRRTLPLGLAILAVGLAALVALRPDGGATVPRHERAQAPLEGPQTLFVSGHSLTAPLAGPMEAMAEAQGRELAILSGHMDGSSIRQRREAGEAFAPPGEATILLVTEQHRLLDSAAYQDTVRELGELQQRFRSANPNGASFFTVPWADLSDPADPRAWIDYERQAAPVWACVVQRAEEQAGAPVEIVPAALALAELVAAILDDPAAFPGFEAASPGEVTQALFTDRVHTAQLGSFYVAALTYAVIFGEPAPVSSGDGEQERALAAFANRFAEAWRQGEAPADACRGQAPRGFILAYTGYMQEAYGDPQAGALRAQLARLRHALGLVRAL